MAKFISIALFHLIFGYQLVAQNSIQISDEDKRIINYHIMDLNEHKDHPVAIGELISEMNFLQSLNPNELSRSEHWFIHVVKLFDLDASQRKIQPKPNFEKLKEELYNKPYNASGFYFDEAFVYDFPEEVESYNSIEITRPYTRNCKEIPNSLKRDECTQKRIQFAVKQHFQTNKAIDLFKANHDRVFVRDYEVTIHTSLRIDKKGKLSALHISSFDPDLSRLAHKAIKRFPRFEPATLNGKAIEAKFNLPIVFTVYAEEYEENEKGFE